jgi:predicted DNA-binding transcriptional regulator YafY
VRITLDLTDQEAEALGLAYEHVRVDMAQKHGWALRDAALDAISKVLTSTPQSALLMLGHHGDQETAALQLAYEDVRVNMTQHGWAVRNTALNAIRKMMSRSRMTEQETNAMSRSCMTEQETNALRLAYEHVRSSLPQEYGRTMRDAALDAIDKVLTDPIKRIETKDEEE